MPKAFLVNKKKRQSCGYVELRVEPTRSKNDRSSIDDEVYKDDDIDRCKANGGGQFETVRGHTTKAGLDWSQYVSEEEESRGTARRCIGFGSIPTEKKERAEDFYNSSSLCTNPLINWKETGRLQESLSGEGGRAIGGEGRGRGGGGGGEADIIRFTGIVQHDSEDSPLDNDYSNDDDDDEDVDDDERICVGGVIQNEEKVCCWRSVPLQRRTNSFDQNQRKTEEVDEEKALTCYKINPFVNCPPLTPDVDTNRLYPKMKTSALAPGDIIRIPLNNSISHNSNNNVNGAQVPHGSPINESLVIPRPDQPYHLQTEIHVTDLYLRHRYLSFPCPPRPTLRDRDWQQGATLFEIGNDERHLLELSYSSAGAPIATRQMPGCIDGVLPSSKKLIRLPAPRFQCTSCQKSYSTLNGLSKHREFHCPSGGQPRQEYHCHQCDKIYTSVSALKMHIRTHTLPCRCKLCGKAFSRPWLLQGHLRTHTGEKPFQCNHCGRAFADRSNLRAHLQTHYEVKQYNCPTCHKTFSRMSLLLKHQHNSCI